MEGRKDGRKGPPEPFGRPLLALEQPWRKATKGRKEGRKEVKDAKAVKEVKDAKAVKEVKAGQQEEKERKGREGKEKRRGKERKRRGWTQDVRAGRKCRM